jgi:hypothetical protein
MERRGFLGLLGGAFSLLTLGKTVEANETIKELQVEVTSNFNVEEFLKLCKEAHLKLQEYKPDYSGGKWSPDNSGYLLDLRAIYLFSIIGLNDPNVKGSKMYISGLDNTPLEFSHDCSTTDGVLYTPFESENYKNLLKCTSFTEMRALVFNTIVQPALEAQRLKTEKQLEEENRWVRGARQD